MKSLVSTPKTKGAPNQGRSSNPDQGALRTAPGRRPFGARLKHCCFCCKSLAGQVVVSRKQCSSQRSDGL